MAPEARGPWASTESRGRTSGIQRKKHTGILLSFNSDNHILVTST